MRAVSAHGRFASRGCCHKRIGSNEEMLSGVNERIEKVWRYVCLAPHNRLRADISNRPAARNGSAASPSRAIAICDGYSSPAPWPTFGTPPVADLGNHGSSHDWTN